MAATFPTSLDGACPYCRSWNVQYLVLTEHAEVAAGTAEEREAETLSKVGELAKSPVATTSADMGQEAAVVASSQVGADAALPDEAEVASSSRISSECTDTTGAADDTGGLDSATNEDVACPAGTDVSGEAVAESKSKPAPNETIHKLLQCGRAAKVYYQPGQPEPASFRCLDCTYGFNLDWSRTSLETIFYWYLNPAAAAAATTSHVVSATASHSSDADSIATARAATAADPEYQHWSRETIQWRATQEAWQGHHAPTTVEVDARAAALELVLSKVNRRNMGAAATEASTASAVKSTPAECSGSTGPRREWVSEFKEYSSTANITSMTGRFAAQSDEEYWAAKGIPKNRDMRLIAHFMDPTQLEETGARVQAKRRKVTKSDVKMFKERKTQKRLEKARKDFLGD